MTLDKEELEMTATAKIDWVQINRIPDHIRWDVPRRHRGQIVEIAFADWRPLSSEADMHTNPNLCALYRREQDGNTGEVTYYSREVKLACRARAFQKIEDISVLVEADGTVRVWDDVGECYTICHSLGKSAIRRIRHMAGV
jgi:hypothetical protein